MSKRTCACVDDLSREDAHLPIVGASGAMHAPASNASELELEFGFSDGKCASIEDASALAAAD